MPGKFEHARDAGEADDAEETEGAEVVFCDEEHEEVRNNCDEVQPRHCVGEKLQRLRCAERCKRV